MASFAGSMDLGAGEPSSYSGFVGVLLARGAGDPMTLDDVGDSIIVIPGDGDPPEPPDGYVPPLPDGSIPPSQGPSHTTNLRVPDNGLLTWEGGYVLALMALVGDKVQPFTKPPYRVDFIDVLGQAHPILESGCYSTVQGQGSDIYPEPDGVTLICASPPLAQGVYRIRLTNSMGDEKLLPGDILVILDLDSFEIDTMGSGIPNTVYPGAHPDKDYPDG